MSLSRRNAIRLTGIQILPKPKLHRESTGRRKNVCTVSTKIVPRTSCSYLWGKGEFLLGVKDKKGEIASACNSQRLCPSACPSGSTTWYRWTAGVSRLADYMRLAFSNQRLTRSYRHNFSLTIFLSKIMHCKVGDNRIEIQMEKKRWVIKNQKQKQEVKGCHI